MSRLSYDARQALRFARQAAEDVPTAHRLACVSGLRNAGSGLAPALALGVLEAFSDLPAAWWPIPEAA